MGSAVGSVVGSVAGNMIAPGIGGQIGGALGGSLFGGGGGSSGGGVSGAYDAASEAQLAAARNAMFRPVGITTNFGSSNFEIDPVTGQLKSAGYTLDPRLKKIQEGLMGEYGGLLSNAMGVDTSALKKGAGSLYSLGADYLGESPKAIREKYINEQNALLAPGQEQTLAGIRNRLAQTGRAGLATGGTSAGNLAQTNPEMAAYYNSIANQQAKIAAGADTEVQNRINFGKGLLAGGAGLESLGYGLKTTAYDPLKTALGLSTSIEGLGANTLALGSELGGRASTAGAAAGSLASTAANTGLAGSIANAGINATRDTTMMNHLTGLFGGGSGAVNTPGYAGPLGNWFNNMIGGGSAITNTSGYNASAFAPDYGTSSGAEYTFY